MADSDNSSARLQVVLDAKVDKLLDAMSKATRGVYGASSQMQKSIDALKAKFDPLGAAAEKAAKDVELFNKYLADGKISADVHAKAIADTKKRYDDLAASLTKSGSAFSLNRNQILIAEGAVHRFADSLLAGQNPMRALLQQSGDIAAIVGMGEGGLSAGLIAAAGGIGLVAAAAIAAVAAEQSWEAEQSKIAVSLQGVAAASGATAAQIDAVGEAASKSGKISAAAGRDAALAFASAHVPATDLAEAVSLVGDYAVATGQKFDKARDELAKAFGEGSKGAEALNDKLEFLNAAQLEQVRSLELQGDRAGALKVIMDSLGSAIGGVSDKQTGLKKWLQDTTTWFQNATTAAGGFIAKVLGLPSSDLVQRAAGLQANLAQAQTGRAALVARGQGNTTASRSDYASGLAQFDAQIADLENKLAAVKGQINQGVDRTASASLAELSQQAAAAADALDPIPHRISDIRKQQALLQSLLKDDEKGTSAAKLAAAGLTADRARADIASGDEQIADLRSRGAPKASADRPDRVRLGPSTDEVIATRDIADTEDRIAVLRQNGDAESLKAAEQRLIREKLVLQEIKGGAAYAQAQADAAKLIFGERYQPNLDTKGFVTTDQSNAVLEKLGEQLNEQSLKVHDATRDAIAGGLEAGFESGLPGALKYFGEAIERSLINNIADSFASLIEGSSKGGAISSIVSSIFGGARASGGPVSAGKGYIVGENGPEWFEPAGSGTIVPNSALTQLPAMPRAGGGGGGFYFDLRGAVVTQDLLDQMNAIGAQATRNGALQGAAIAHRTVPATLARQQRQRLG